MNIWGARHMTDMPLTLEAAATADKRFSGRRGATGVPGAVPPCAGGERPAPAGPPGGRLPA
ncbi:hypothetical protein Pta02_48560 [Planobispora takensis]|uniref:Uncharacterized protein n=1 Tax=Planobispora takensis TaxID=1367882 RepID=A0A8J3SZ55_9ACTN|nr:hypothetical protein Pta02_48560 [Planobispora takensis]